MDNKHQIFITDDHPLVAEGIKAMLYNAADYEIVGSAKNAAQTLIALAENTVDTLLLDINLPDIDGIQLCAQLRKSYPKLYIIALTSLQEIGILQRFLHAGGNGFLMKDTDINELLLALEVIRNGEIYLTKSLNTANLHTDASKQPPMLTRREKEILQLLSQGMNGPEIAEKLFLSPLTVETHRKNMIQKLGVSGTVALINEAKRLLLI